MHIGITRMATTKKTINKPVRSSRASKNTKKEVVMPGGNGKKKSPSSKKTAKPKEKQRMAMAGGNGKKKNG